MLSAGGLKMEEGEGGLNSRDSKTQETANFLTGDAGNKGGNIKSNWRCASFNCFEINAATNPTIPASH